VRLRMPARPLTAGALSLAATAAVAIPAAAQGPAAPAEPAQPAAAGGTEKPRISVQGRRLHLRAGRRARVRGRVLPGVAGLPVSLQMRRGKRWITLDRGRTRPTGAFKLRDRQRTALSARVRLRVRGAKRGLGRLNVYRYAHASWYGPGLYGNRLGCGGTLGTGTLGVAHKTLPCGTRVTLRNGRRSVRVRVIDRGPYVAGREYDLTAATAQRLGFSGHGAILVTR
jgi:rare lipoprotein A